MAAAQQHLASQPLFPCLPPTPSPTPQNGRRDPAVPRDFLSLVCSFSLKLIYFVPWALNPPLIFCSLYRGAAAASLSILHMQRMLDQGQINDQRDLCDAVEAEAHIGDSQPDLQWQGVYCRRTRGRQST